MSIIPVVRPRDGNGDPLSPVHWKFTYYQHDAQGNILAVYEIADRDNECGYEMCLSQHVLYGSSRLGVANYGHRVKLGEIGHGFPYYNTPALMICLDDMEEPDDIIAGVAPMGTYPGIFTQSPGGKKEWLKPVDMGAMSPSIAVLGVHNYSNPSVVPQKVPVGFVPGRKQYEFSNHLGNVLVTVSDMPIGVDEDSDGTVDYYMPNVLTVSDYEPFGAQLENRAESEANTKYDWGYNGVEKENDLYGEGNAYAFEYRIHDARIGRFLSVDPLANEYPWNSTYAFAENKVLWGKDLEGRELSYATEAIADYILEVVEASDLDEGTKGLIAYGIGIYQGVTYGIDPVRQTIDGLNLSFQALKTGLPLALQIIQKGSITPQEAKALGLSHPIVMIINGKLEQMRKANEQSIEGSREGGRLAAEFILIFTAARAGLKASFTQKEPKPTFAEPEMTPASQESPNIAPKGTPKPSPKFQTPTNAPQEPITNVPEGYNVRVMKPTQQYPNGYWVLEKPMPQGGFQKVDPSTMKPGAQHETHVPLPEGYWE